MGDKRLDFGILRNLLIIRTKLLGRTSIKYYTSLQKRTLSL